MDKCTHVPGPEVFKGCIDAGCDNLSCIGTREVSLAIGHSTLRAHEPQKPRSFPEKDFSPTSDGCVPFAN